MVCVDIKIVTKMWGEENRWIFGSCASAQAYEAETEYTEECCQLAGSYELVCIDLWGDGWTGGYIQIGDDERKWCKDFKEGGEQSQEVEMSGNLIFPLLDSSNLDSCKIMNTVIFCVKNIFHFSGAGPTANPPTHGPTANPPSNGMYYSKQSQLL